MFEQDYLMRMLLLFFKAIARSYEIRHDDDDPRAAADMLEDAIGNAVEIDPAALLSLAPESMAQVMRVTGVDPNVVQFVARSLLLESGYLADAGADELSEVRRLQAHAVAREYGFDLPDEAGGFEALTEGLEQAAMRGGFDADAGDDALEALLEDYGLAI